MVAEQFWCSPLPPPCAFSLLRVAIAMTPEALNEIITNLATLVQVLAVNAQAAAAATPIGVGGGGFHKRTISAKSFSKLSKFSKCEGEWEEFGFDFVVTLGSKSPEMLRVLKVLETMSEEMNTPKVKDMDPDLADRINID